MPETFNDALKSARKAGKRELESLLVQVKASQFQFGSESEREIAIDNLKAEVEDLKAAEADKEK